MKLRLIALLGVLALLAAACGGTDTTTTTAAAVGDTTTTTEAMPDETTTTVDGTTDTTEMMMDAIKTCLVTDLAGVDDRSFNASAWQGVQDAMAAGYATEDSFFLESTDA